VFFSKSSVPAAADPDSEDESYEPRAYVINAIQSSVSPEGGSHATHDIVSDDDSIPGLIDDSDSDDDSDVAIRHVRRRLPMRSRVDPSNRSFQGVYVAGRTSAARIVDDSISGPSVFCSLQPLGTYATATQSKRVEDNLSWVLDSMANVNVACNPELVVHLRATDVAGLRRIGGTTKLEEIGTHPLWGDVFIDRSQPYNILSLHQAQVHGFRELTSQDQQRKILSNPERGIALVFHKYDADKFYKLHASKVVEFIRKMYSIVRAEFTPLISSREPRRQSDFIRRLIIHLTKRC
jgi:hypothetical protein